MSELKQRKANASQDIKEKKVKKEESIKGNNFITYVYFIWILLGMNFMASYLITETFTWGYKNKWTNIRNYMPRKEIILSPEELSKYDGTNPDLPIYLAIDGEVYDVSAGKQYYGKGGSYAFFSGKDAARSYVTGCFKEHLTHDLRGLTKDDIKGIEGWKDFYKNSDKYFYVGKVLNPVIPDDAPLPVDCSAQKKPDKKSDEKPPIGPQPKA